MSYSVIGAGRNKLSQSQAIHTDLANKEDQRNAINSQIKQQKKSNDTSAVMTTAGTVAGSMAAAPAGVTGLAAIGPVGWVALGGLAAYAIFR